MVYTRSEMEELARVVEKHEGLFVISDEIYEHIIFSGKHESMASFDFIYDRVITVNGVSKGYAMTGWRIGYIGAPLWLAKAVNKLQGQFTSGVSSIGQRAALTAITSGCESCHAMRDVFLKRRDMVCSLLKDIDGLKIRVPQGAFYIFPEVTDFFGKSDGETVIKNANDLAMYILEKGHVAVVCGEGFGAPAYIRLSYAASEDELREACSRMKEALKKLK
jgi:aspartate aminotransferase